MSSATPESLPAAPRVLVVLPGLATAGGSGFSPLAHARLDHLSAMARTGHVARLRVTSPMLPPCDLTVAAALLGHSPPDLVDRAAVAAAALGLPAGGTAAPWFVDVLTADGRPASILDVARAAERLGRALPGHALRLPPHGHRLLVTGAEPPALPSIDGLELRVSARGWTPRPGTSQSHVVIGEPGSALLDVARLLDLEPETIAGVDVGRSRRQDAGLRDAAIHALASGARSVVVESRALVPLRMRPRDPATRRRELVRALTMLDRVLIGPLHAAAAWCGGAIAVTTDLPRDDAGRVARGDVPLVVAGAGVAVDRRTRSSAEADDAARTGLPPFTEAAVSDAPVVRTPWSRPARHDAGPRRFERDRRTGVTHAAFDDRDRAAA